MSRVGVHCCALAEVERYAGEQLVPALTLDVRGKNPANPLITRPTCNGPTARREK